MRSPETGGRPTERKIGEVLIEQGKISREQLEEALEVQKTNEKYVGRILVSLGYVGEEDLARGLGTRLGTKYVALLEEQVDDEVLGIITEDVLFPSHKNRARYRKPRPPPRTRRGWRSPPAAASGRPGGAPRA